MDIKLEGDASSGDDIDDLSTASSLSPWSPTYRPRGREELRRALYQKWCSGAAKWVLAVKIAGMAMDAGRERAAYRVARKGSPIYYLSKTLRKAFK